MKRIKCAKLWLVLAVVALIMLLTIPAMATEGVIAPETPERMITPVTKARFTNTRTSTVNLSVYVNVDDFVTDFLNQSASCPDYVDISKYNIPYTTILKTELMELIWYRTPLAYHVRSIGFTYNTSTNKLTKMNIGYYSYADTKTEYTSCYNAFVAGANKLLQGIEGNGALTDVQKALLLHDRLVQWVAYDWENFNQYGGNSEDMPDTDFTAYGVFGKRVAVCQGYAMAYMYMLDRVGIESDYVSSDTLSHGWNIVYINNKPYHVDTTWDDPDVLGMVEHDNFLLSSDGLWDTGHEAYDYNTAPTDTTFDNYFWGKSKAEFQLIGDSLYYLDNQSGEICAWTAGSTDIKTRVVRTDSDNWGGYGNFSRLGTKNGMLMYSTPTKVYLVNPAGGGRSTFYTPACQTGESIYGFTYENGVLKMLLSTTPNINSITTERYISVTMEASQYTVTFKNYDGSVLSQKVYEKGDALQLPPDPVRSAGVNYTYTFAGWSPTVKMTVNEDAEYTATYNKVLKKSYTIRFVNWDGSLISEKKVKEGDAVTIPANPSRPDDANYSYQFAGWSPAVKSIATADAVYQATYTAKPIAVNAKNGWYNVGGKWYFYEKGVMVKNAWRKDSKGWCWLTASGAMATNAWVRDSKGWCYVEASGYCATNCWKKDSVGWIWLDSEGSMTKSSWIKDGGKWYYLDENGYMVSNQWRRDSKGWCWLTASGAMATNAWVRDSKGWCYVEASGYCATNCWKKDSIGWIWLDSEGSMTKNQWVLDGGKWYYLDANGYMLANTTWNGYRFNSSGVCTNP